AGAAAALDDVLGATDRSGDDVDLRLEAHAAHSQGFLDAVLLVDDEFLRQHMEDFAVLRDVDGAGGVDDARHVRGTDLLVLHRHHALRVESADMSAGDARVDGADLAASHQLGLLDRALDGGNGGLDVDHHALAQAPRRVLPDADDVEPGLPRLADDAADLGGPDVEPDDELAPLLRHVYRASVCSGLRPPPVAGEARSSSGCSGLRPPPVAGEARSSSGCSGLRPPPVAGEARSSSAASWAEAQSGRAGLSRSMRTARSPRWASADRTRTRRRSFRRKSRSPRRISCDEPPWRATAVSP